MASQAVQEFVNFLDSTDAIRFSDPETRINDAMDNAETLGYILRGQQMADVLQGGSSIKDQIYLTMQRLMHEYKPLETETPQIVESGVTWQVPWRHAVNQMTWTEHTVILNAGSDMNSKARGVAYKNIWRNMKQNYATDTMTFWEEIAWRIPDRDEMEAQNGRKYNSIPVFVNQFPNGLFVPGTGSGLTSYATAGTVMGIDVPANPNWAPSQYVYSTGAATGFDTPQTVNGILSALDLAFIDTKFQPPPWKSEYFEDPISLKTPGAFLAVSSRTLQALMHVYRASQNVWANKHDPYGMPVYAGAPIVRIGQLDTARLYPISTTNTGTESTADVKGGRIYGIQPKYLRFVWHKDKFDEPTEVLTDITGPFVHAKYYDTWGNMLATSRKRHFILYPTTSQTLNGAAW